MARKPKEQQAEETQAAEVYSSSPNFAQVDVIDDGAPLVNLSPVGPSAVARDGRAAVEVPPPRRYQVLQTQYVMGRGGRTILRAGKIVDEGNYDVPALRSQGVQLEALD